MNTHQLCCTLVVAASLGGPTRAWGQCDPVELQKLTASDASDGDWFGYSVAIFGETAVISAQLDDLHLGSAYVFARIGGEWEEVAKLAPADLQKDDHFGHSVAGSGNTIVVGARTADDERGAAYVYEFHDDSWIQVAKLIVEDGEQADYFGRSVGVSDDTIVVGAEGDSPGGSAYIYERNVGIWTFVTKIAAYDTENADQFGESLSISGNTVIVGASWDDDLGNNSGSAYVFERENGLWDYEGKLNADDGSAGDHFGTSIALHGETALIGASSADGWRGSAYVFERVEGGWKQRVKLTDPEGEPLDSFGHSVAVSGDKALIGAPLDDDWSGAVFVSRRIDGLWTDVVKFVASDTAEGDRFGWFVSIYDDSALVGAFGDDDFGEMSGSAYVIDLVPDGPPDCNMNGILDSCDILLGTSEDDDGNGIPDECDCLADFTGDGFVGAADLSILLGFWGVPEPPFGDLNNDGTVGPMDLAILLGNWGPCP